MPYGIDQADWDIAKDEVRAVLIERAKHGRTIPYSELVLSITVLEIEPHDQRLFKLLGEVSTEENACGRPMLSAIVVHKDGDQQPGPGFFDLAADLGRDVSDRDVFWATEVGAIYDYWRQAARK